MTTYPADSGRWRIVVASILAVLCVASLSAQQPTPPTAPRTVYSHFHYERPPSTLEGLWNAVPVVVLVEVMASRPRELPRPQGEAGPSLLLMEHDLKVIETFRDVGYLGPSRAVIKVSQEVDTVGANRFEILRVGQRMILFLESYAFAGTFSVAYGPQGVLTVDAAKGVVQVPDYISHTMAFFQNRQSIPLSELIAKFRALPVRH